MSITIHRVVFLAALAAVAAALTVPNVASADPTPTTVKISQNAQFVTPFEIDAQVTLSCTAGWGYWVNVNAVQPQGWGFTLFGGGGAGGQCTGQQQKIAVALFSGATWLLGNAVATADVCAGPCAGDTRELHIGL